MWRQGGRGSLECGGERRLPWYRCGREVRSLWLRLLRPRSGGGMVAPAAWEIRPMPAFRNVLAMIGNTPLVEVARIDTGKCRLFLKLENQNPGGSIKDRIALSMIEAAEGDGWLKAGGTIIEATAGNTGLGLALVAAQKGYRL